MSKKEGQFKDLDDFMRVCLIDIIEGNDVTVNTYCKNKEEQTKNDFINGVRHAFSMISDYASLEILFDEDVL